MKLGKSRIDTETGGGDLRRYKDCQSAFFFPEANFTNSNLLGRDEWIEKGRLSFEEEKMEDRVDYRGSYFE